MVLRWLRGLWRKVRTVPRFYSVQETPEPDIHAEVRNAAQRFSSSSRLVGLKATKDSRATLEMLAAMRRAQAAIESANSALKIVERGRDDAA